MSYLVDTNVLSEGTKPHPDLSVLEWLRRNEPQIYVSSITIGELRRGIERLSDGQRKTDLRAWLQAVCARLGGRILAFNTSTVHLWGQHKAIWDRAGTVVPSLDSQIAATALRYGLTLVTRNQSDFKATGVKLLNPFSP